MQSEYYPGMFIVLEGGEGAGKSTAILAIKEKLLTMGFGPDDIVHVREPGGTVLAEKLRELVKSDHEGEQLCDMTELAIMMAARVQLVENVIKPAMREGKVVLGDRHMWSSIAYQGYGRQQNVSAIGALKDIMMGDFEPDVTLLLDLDPELGMARARGRGELDRIELSGMDFFRRVREGYLALANTPSTDGRGRLVVDASGNEAFVAGQLGYMLSEIFPNGRSFIRHAFAPDTKWTLDSPFSSYARYDIQYESNNE